MLKFGNRALFRSPEDDIHAEIVRLIASAQTQIRILMYAFTLPDVTNLLLVKHQAGVDVALVLDASQAGPGNPAAMMTASVETQLGGAGEASQILRLSAAGVPYVVGNSSHGGILHGKYAICDGTLLWGSYNWSLAAARENNQVEVTTAKPVVRFFLDDWNQNWTRLAGRTPVGPRVDRSATAGRPAPVVPAVYHGGIRSRP